MDFASTCLSFKNKLAELLDSKYRNDHHLTEEEIKAAYKILKNCGKFCIKGDKWRLLIHEMPTFFLLLINYLKQDETSPENNFTVRRALNTLLFVLRRTNICNDSFKKMIQVITKVTEYHGDLLCIKNFLRFYIKLMKEVSVSSMLGKNKLHKSFLVILNNLLKNANDVDLQAVIFEIFLRYAYLKNYSDTFQEIFSLLSELVPAIGTVSCNISKGVRFLLNNLNKISLSVFSIACYDISLDDVSVAAYNGDEMDVWLDINVSSRILSFFCEETFLSFTSPVKVCSLTNWDTLSFHAEDILNFNANSDSEEYLEIVIKLKTSSFTLFPKLGMESERRLLIKISKHTPNYNEFIETVLPQLLPKKCSSEAVITTDSARLKEFSSSNGKRKISTIMTSFNGDLDKESTMKISEVKQKSFNQSITPISFTGSTVGRSRKVNISSSYSDETDKENMIAQKISISEKIVTRKISSNLTALVTSERVPSPVVIDLTIKGTTDGCDIDRWLKDVETDFGTGRKSEKLWSSDESALSEDELQQVPCTSEGVSAPIEENSLRESEPIKSVAKSRLDSENKAENVTFQKQENDANSINLTPCNSKKAEPPVLIDLTREEETENWVKESPDKTLSKDELEQLENILSTVEQLFEEPLQAKKKDELKIKPQESVSNEIISSPKDSESLQAPKEINLIENIILKEANPVSVQSDTNQKKKSGHETEKRNKMKRKLFNPNDLSYLTKMDETDWEISKKKKQKKTPTTVKSEKKKHVKSETKPFRFVFSSNSSSSAETELTFRKAFKSLKNKVTEYDTKNRKSTSKWKEVMKETRPSKKHQSDDDVAKLNNEMHKCLVCEDASSIFASFLKVVKHIETQAPALLENATCREIHKVLSKRVL